MNAKLRIGIIGTGFIADVIAHAIRDADSVEITGVASRRVEVAREFASKHGHPRVFASWTDLLAWDGIDAVYVATPTFVREEISVASARAGKHVLADKPFLSFPSVRAITGACREAGVAFMDATHFTHHPRTARLRSELPDRIGALECLHTSFFFPAYDRNNIRLNPAKEPTGAIGDMAWYCMRAIVEYTADDVRIVAAHGHGFRDPVTRGFVRGTGVVRLSDGSTSTWDAGYTVGAGVQELHLLGQKGMVQIDDFVLDWAGSVLTTNPDYPVGFTHRAGPGDPSTYTRVPTPSRKRQATLMMERFAALASDPRGPEVAASMRRSERTQEMVDAIYAGLLHQD